MTHRGPDSAGLWWSEDGTVGLAHRRLSIIDLSPAASQPMVDSTGTLTIIFNGEIHNFKDLRRELESRGYRFLSNSDTEVILAAYRQWGVDCLSHLSGMFSIGLYDSVKRSLFLARDRAGEKPLFYWHREGAISFASELKALMADPDLERRLDPISLDLYLTFGYVPNGRCIIRGVNKLPPAHAALFDLHKGHLRVWRYWDLPAPHSLTNGQCREDEELVSELNSLLEDSVKRQLVADVPVGILLSGGLDSSLVTAMASRTGSKIKTFTITFPGYGVHDEARHARLIAEWFGTEHEELPASPATLDLLPVLAQQYDEPIVDSSMIPTYLVSNMIRQHCTVALGGDGGDELFGGYDHYSRLLRLTKMIGWIPRPLRKVAGNAAEVILPTGFRGRNYFTGMGADLHCEAPHVARLFDRSGRERLLSGDVRHALIGHADAEETWKAYVRPGADLLDSAQRADFKLYLAKDILVKVDRAAMLSSLETRAPFLDHRIIEFAFGKVPSRLKVNNGSKKLLPKKLGKRLLPNQFDWGRKQGFSIPLAHWLRNDWRKSFESLLLDKPSPVFQREEIEQLWKNHQRGFHNSERLFGVGMFELWRRHYNIVE